MADLTKHVMINKWDDDINNAIQEVGGNTYGSEGLPDYAGIIKTQLISNTAIDDKTYQNFLYVDEDNQTSSYPWDGEPTPSKNAIQSSVVAESIKQLYDIMLSSERFNVLLVDEIPNNEINLSAIYLLKSKCCDDSECSCVEENIYYGCYFVKTGKKLKRIDIPKFKVNLSELFFLTREEYAESFSQYVNKMEEILKRKFGKYWVDEGFSLDETIDNIVLELKAELHAESDSIIEKLNTKFDTLEENVSKEIAEMKKNIEERVKKSNLIPLYNEINNLQ